MKIKYKGQDVEAYSLTIYKKHAMEILSGEKTIEMRNDSPKNFQMFVDEEKVKDNIVAMEDGRDKDWVCPLKRTNFIHFYDRGGRFSLDVRIDACGYAVCQKEDIEMLNEEYGYHDMDEYVEKYKDLEFHDKPCFYWFHIAEIVESRGLE